MPSPNNIQINNVSKMNTKNSYGIQYSKYILMPLSVLIVIISVLFGLQYAIQFE